MKDTSKDRLDNSIDHLNLSFLNGNTKGSTSVYTQNEMKRLEEELDIQEIELKTYNFIERNDPETGFKEFGIYKEYLEGLSGLIKQQDVRMGNGIIRGLIGLIRASKKICVKGEIEKPSIMPKKRTREQLTQTFEVPVKQPKYHEPKDTASHDLEIFKDLASRFKNISRGDLTQKLNDLHLSLTLMVTDVPSPSETPDLFDIKIVKVVEDIEQNIKVIQNEIETHLNRKKNSLKSEKLSQTEGKLVDLLEHNILSSLLKEKEIKIMKQKQKIQSLKSKLVEVDKQIQTATVYITTYKEKIIELEEILRKQKTEIADLSQNLDESKKIADKLKGSYDAANEKLKDLSFDVYTAKLNALIMQEKLSQIETE